MGEGRAYLEKSIQVVYRMPPSEEHLVRKLIHEYARESGTADLIDDTVAGILAEGTGRNPRRIKRIINSFVLEYSLDPAWRKLRLGEMLLVTAILLQHLYAPFYDLLTGEEAGENPIMEFLDYVRVRAKLPDPPANAEDPWWAIAKRSFTAHELPVPEPSPIDTEKRREQLKELEGKLPGNFADLARNKAFVALLKRVEDNEASDLLRAQLVRRPLSTASIQAVVTRNERKHLENLLAGSTSNYRRSGPLQTELRRLREIGLITSKRYIADMPKEFDLSDWVELTDRGYDYLRRRDESSTAD